MVEEIVEYLRRSGWVQQSVEAVLPDLPRWERHLRNRASMPFRLCRRARGRLPTLVHTTS